MDRFRKLNMKILIPYEQQEQMEEKRTDKNQEKNSP